MNAKCLLIGLPATMLLASIAPAQEREPDPGFGRWITVFDGSTFDGWYASKPEGADWNWAIDDGAMTNMADPAKRKHNVATTRKFHNFEAHVEFKVRGENEGNSGLYLRGRAEIQIRDSYGKLDLNDPEAKRHVGALYQYAPPLANASRPAGEWNEVDLRFIGTHLNVLLNGVLVQNNTFLPHKTGQGRTDAFDSPGIFELQGDHDKVWFRNIRVRPMFEQPGWRPLFNGTELTGWRSIDGAEGKWVVENGELTNVGFPIPDLLTEEDFGDFLLHYEYKSEGNSGLFLRNLWEIQIHNSHGKEATKNSDGALYDFFPPRVNMSKPQGEWSVVEVALIGRKITVFHNGVLTHDGAECPARTYNTRDASNLDAPGPIRLQGDHGRVWFTNLWILPLE